MIRSFLRDDDLTPAEQARVLRIAAEMKANRTARQPLSGPQGVAIIFDKPTLRTQLSFSVGVAELGGYPMVVDGNLAQIGARESISDVAKVIGRQVSAIVWRTYGQERVEEMARLAVCRSSTPSPTSFTPVRCSRICSRSESTRVVSPG